MADVFISYKSDDRAWAQALNDLLESNGLSVWWDTSLLAGQQFPTMIRQELDNAHAVVVVWSQKSWESHWVQAEATMAWGALKLVAIRIDNVRIHVPFNTTHTTYLNSMSALSNSENAEQLISAVKTLVPAVETTGATPTEDENSIAINRTVPDRKIALAVFQYNDGFSDEGGSNRFLRLIRAHSSSRGINLDIVSGTRLAINCGTSHELPDGIPEGPFVFLRFGEAMPSMFYEDIVQHGERWLYRDLDPIKSILVSRADTDGTSLAQLSQKDLENTAVKIADQIASVVATA